MENNQPRSRKLMWLVPLLILLAVAVVVGGLVLAGKLKLKLDRATMTGYQAVFLNNNQVYFGKMEESSRDWVKLTDVYYLQVTGGLQQAAGSEAATEADKQQEMKLVKLGSELHGPQDEMYIGRDKVMFWENMKEDSKVMEAISKYRTK